MFQRNGLLVGVFKVDIQIKNVSNHQLEYKSLFNLPQKYDFFFFKGSPAT